MQHEALEQPADGLQADVRMGRDLHTGTPADLVRAVVVEEAPGADGAQRPLRQQPADLGAVADGRLAGLDHVYRPEYLPIFSRDVLRRIAANDDSWEDMVPEQVAELIKRRGFFGYIKPDARD